MLLRAVASLRPGRVALLGIRRSRWRRSRCAQRVGGKNNRPGPSLVDWHRARLAASELSCIRRRSLGHTAGFVDLDPRSRAFNLFSTGTSVQSGLILASCGIRWPFTPTIGIGVWRARATGSPQDTWSRTRGPGLAVCSGDTVDPLEKRAPALVSLKEEEPGQFSAGLSRGGCHTARE